MAERVNLADQLVRNVQLALAHARGEYTPARIEYVTVEDGELKISTAEADAREYAVIIEREGDAYAAHAPDVPGHAATAPTAAEALAMLGERLSAHLARSANRGEHPPEATTIVARIRVPVPPTAHK